MSRMNQNRKTSSKVPNQGAPKASRSGAQGPQSSIKNNKPRQRSQQIPNLNNKQSLALVQNKSRKSRTGSSYNDGFDVISRPDSPDLRVEEFDELVATLNGSVAFAITQFSANPGNSTTFPRLSRIAVLYEKYMFEELDFYFQHDVSQFATQGAQGLVLLSALYDAASAAPTSKTMVEATKPHVICMPNQNSLLRMSKERLHPKGYPLYVRSTGVLGGDIKTYDAGNLFASTQGMAGATEVGELHVRGRVRLYDQILDASASSAPPNTSSAFFQNTAAQTITTAVATNMLLATASVNGIGAVNTAGSIVLPAGNYSIDYQFIGTDTSAEAFNIVANLMKNGVTVFQVVPQVATNVSLGANARLEVSYSAIVSSNGTDAFTFPVTMVGAAGTLAVNGSVVITAV